MPPHLKVGFRWILRAKTAVDAEAAVDVLKHLTGEVTHVRRSGDVVRWSTDGEAHRVVALLADVAGQLERRRHSSYAACRVIVPAPTEDELLVLREALAHDGMLVATNASVEALATLDARIWVERVPGTSGAYRLTDLGRRWAEPEKPGAA